MKIEHKSHIRKTSQTQNLKENKYGERTAAKHFLEKDNKISDLRRQIIEEIPQGVNESTNQKHLLQREAFDTMYPSGSFRGPVLRSPMMVETPRSLRTATPSCSAPKKDDPKNRSSMYVGGAKAQNPMKKVGIAWVIGFPSGILLFLLAKNKVDRRRLEQMRTRQRMRDANKGVYMSERFTRTA